MLYDVNCYYGAWPFSIFRELTAPRLATHLARSGIDRAAVSPFGAVFHPEPMPANRALFKALKPVDTLHPLPVVNPMLANWREQMRECRTTFGARTIRLFPNYHRYRLSSPRLDPFMTTVAEAGLRIVVSVRLEDERGRYHALDIKGVPLADLSAFLRRHPECTPLLTGLSVGELLKLAEEHTNFVADLSYAENIALAGMLRGKIGISRLMFGTNTPLYSAQAQAAKLTADTFSARERQQIGRTNALAFFG